MARDYYAEAEAIAARLAQLGEQAWADRLTNAIEEGFTSTEILMALRHHLRGLLAAGPQLDDALRERVSSLEAAIAAALA